jgi:putative transposase
MPVPCARSAHGETRTTTRWAEAVNGLYKAELIRKRGPWRSLKQVELATAEWVDWWNQRRLHGAIHDMPPAEFEALYHQQRVAAAAA